MVHKSFSLVMLRVFCASELEHSNFKEKGVSHYPLEIRDFQPEIHILLIFHEMSDPIFKTFIGIP